RLQRTAWERAERHRSRGTERSVLPSRNASLVAADRALQVGTGLLEVRLGLEVLEVDGLDGAHAVDEGKEVDPAGLVTDLRGAQRLLGLRDVRRQEEVPLRERCLGAQVRLPHLAPDPVLQPTDLGL